MLWTRFSTEPDTVFVFALTSSAAAETRFAWAVVSSAAALICWLTLVNSSEALARVWVLSLMPSTSVACRRAARLNDEAIRAERRATPSVVRPKIQPAKRFKAATGADTSAWSMSDTIAHRTASLPGPSAGWMTAGPHEERTGSLR